MACRAYLKYRRNYILGQIEDRLSSLELAFRVNDPFLTEAKHLTDIFIFYNIPPYNNRLEAILSLHFPLENAPMYHLKKLQNHR